MQAVSYLAPAIAPLAIKLIDKYIFDDQRAPAPQIIQIPVPPQCSCCCGQQSTDEYDNNTDRTCSTCASKSSSYYHHSKKNRLSTKKGVRSSSTSDAYEKERSKTSIRSRSTLRLYDDPGKSEKRSDKHGDVNTLDILAVHLKKEISSRHSKGKTSTRVPEFRSTEKSSSKSSSKSKSGSSTRKSSCRSVQESKSSSSSSRKRNSDSDGLRLSKAGCTGC